MQIELLMKHENSNDHKYDDEIKSHVHIQYRPIHEL